ncbi:MAG TPA: LPS export ABC transporter ATP-binding protein [Chthonomonadaceae bacterium]|nr:LPS export ABC transporter ATP-binding protein [Chthonomonadaceae bacterium]
MEIRTENLVKIYRGRRVVNNISLEIQEGEVVGLLGPNGAGKTTTFYMIVGLVKPNSGQVLLDGQDITRRPMYKRARAGIGYLPQEASVFRNLTVWENLYLVLQMQPLSQAERKARAEALLEDLHITHLRNHYGKTLSGGERRRVEIARALAASPRFILLDEPFTGVDPKAIEDIETIIYRLSKRDKIGILITDHNVEAMLRITERAYIIADGEKRVSGPSRQLLHDPEARAAYFGERYGQRRDLAREAAEAELQESLGGDWSAETPEENGDEDEGGSGNDASD